MTDPQSRHSRIQPFSVGNDRNSLGCELLRRYSLAILATLVAIWARVEMTPWLGDRVPFGICFISTLTIAWIAGTGPALAATLMSSIAIARFVMLPAGHQTGLDSIDWLALSIYVLVTLSTIVLFHLVSSGRQQSEDSANENARLNSELKVADQKKDEFLALLAHELRNPLAPIRTAIDMMDNVSDPEAHQNAREIIRRQVGHLVTLVDDLMDVSRYVQGRLRLKKKRVDLRDAVEQAVEMNLPRIHRRSQNLSVDLANDAVYVIGDRDRLTQIVGNLLHNASKYTPAEGNIRILLTTDDSVAHVHIQDDGIGIPPELSEQIFELFSQANSKRTRREGGLGIGLALVRQLVQLSGGTIQVVSEGLGRGSTFTVTLPVCEEGSSARIPTDTLTFESSSNTIEVKAAHQPEQMGSQRILMVDDNQDSVKLMNVILKSEGYETATAFDGFQALKIAREFHPDTILLDIGLPGIDGYEVARTLRREERFKPTRIIAISGWGTDEDRERSQQAGIDLHLVKPFVPRDLLQILREPEPVDSVR